MSYPDTRVQTLNKEPFTGTSDEEAEGKAIDPCARLGEEQTTTQVLDLHIWTVLTTQA